MLKYTRISDALFRHNRLYVINMSILHTHIVVYSITVFELLGRSTNNKATTQAEHVILISFHQEKGNDLPFANVSVKFD